MIMNELINLIKSLPNLKFSGGVSQAAIEEAQFSLGMRFAKDYSQYLLNFGQMQASGIELTGITDKKLTSVIKVTLEERKRNTVPANLYVIEDLGIDGIIYAQDSQGLVFELSPGAQPYVIAESLFQYIQSSQIK